MTREQPPEARGWSLGPRAIGLAILLLLVAYVVFRPSWERRFGVSLPPVPLGAAPETTDRSVPPRGLDDAPNDAPPGTPASVSPPADATPEETSTTTGALPQSSAAPAAQPAPESRSPAATPRRDPSPERPAAAPRATRESSSGRGATKPRLGQLTEIGGGVQRSTAGLRYTPGSEEGHRLKHVLRHDNDIPDRPGAHGVFDGDTDTLLAVIDEAYLLVQQGSPQVKTEQQGNRQVHEVDLRRRIGFVGGQVGQRRRHPPATHVRLILEGDRVISAFPF